MHRLPREKVAPLVLMAVLLAASCQQVAKAPPENPEIQAGRTAFATSNKDTEARIAWVRILENLGPERDRARLVAPKGGVRPALVKGREPWRLEAIAVLEEGIKADPNHAGLHNILGANLYYDKERKAETLEHFKRARELSPDWEAPHYNVGLMLEGNKESREEALACYRRAVELKDDYWEAWENMADLLVELGRREESIPAYRAALAHNGFQARIPYKLGRELERLNAKDPEVERRYQTAVLLDPSDVDFHAALIRHLRAQGGRDAEVLRLSEAMIQRLPDDPVAAGIRGTTLEEVGGDPAGAERLLRAALQRHPKWADLWFRLGGVLYEQTARVDEAIDAYRKALEFDPEYDGAWFNIGQLELYRKKNYIRAMDCFDACLKIFPGHTGAPFRRLYASVKQSGWNEANRKRLVELIELAGREPGYRDRFFTFIREEVPDDVVVLYADRVPELFADSGEAWVDRGYYFYRKGAYGEALGAAAKAAELKYVNSEYERLVGLTLASIPGREGEAIPHLEACVKVNDKYSLVRTKLGHAVMATTGRYAEAAPHFDRGVELDSSKIDAMLARGRARLNARLFAEAGADAEDLYAAAPGRKDVRLLRIEVMAALDKNQEALQESSKLLAEFPRDTEVMELQVQQLISNGRAEDALALLQQLGQEYPGKIQYWRMRAGVLFSLDRWEDALAWMDYVLQTSSGTADDYGNRAYMVQFLGKRSEAKEGLLKGLQVSPDNPICLYSLGLIAQIEGEFEKAADNKKRWAKTQNYEFSVLSDTLSYVRLAEGDEAVRAFPGVTLDEAGRPKLHLAALGNYYWPKGEWLELKQAVENAERTDSVESLSKHYAPLWGWIAAQRAGQPFPAAWLEKYLAKPISPWHAYLLEYFLGRHTDEELLTRAGEGTRRQKVEQLCEARYYLGTQLELRGRIDEAVALYHQAIDEGLFGFYEVAFASHDLRRLKR